MQLAACRASRPPRPEPFPLLTATLAAALARGIILTLPADAWAFSAAAAAVWRRQLSPGPVDARYAAAALEVRAAESPAAACALRAAQAADALTPALQAGAAALEGRSRLTARQGPPGRYGRAETAAAALEGLPRRLVSMAALEAFPAAAAVAVAPRSMRPERAASEVTAPMVES